MYFLKMNGEIIISHMLFSVGNACPVFPASERECLDTILQTICTCCGRWTYCVQFITRMLNYVHILFCVVPVDIQNFVHS